MSEDIKTILSMLSYRRPAGSKTEKEFIDRFISPLGTAVDPYGNHVLRIADDDVLWSSHTDTVHMKAGYQKVSFDGRIASLPKNSKSDCLGADCAAGVWIMTEMIKAGVPGLYVFHFAEEIGAVGSKAILKNTPEFLSGIQAAIAFDRRGIDSVITHQGKRCCSDAFGLSLAAQLPPRFKLDPTGVFTDTRIYMPVVPECTNISVGYVNEHHPIETLDLAHLLELRDYMVKIDASKFVIERDPKAIPPEQPKQIKFLQDLFLDQHQRTIEDLVYHYPGETARFLEEMGVSFDELHESIHGPRELLSA
jgi:hypothetical protein